MTRITGRTLSSLPEIDDATRREFLIGLGSLLVLAPYGCGEDDRDEGASSGIRIEHDAGATNVEAPARRVAVIGDETVDLLAALGVEPAGFASTRVQGTVGGKIEDYYVDIGEPIYLGQEEAPSVERLAALEPDLIVMDTFEKEELYERVSGVAPTLAYDILTPGWWRDPLVGVGRATGREERARPFVADYDALVSDLRRRAEPVVEASPTLALVYAPDASTTFVLDQRNAVADPYAKLGFDLLAPAGVEIPETGLAPISQEVVGDLAADTIVVLRIGGNGGRNLEQLPIEDILDALEGSGGTRVLRQVVDPMRPSSSPIADRQAIEQAAELLLGDREGSSEGPPSR